MTAAGGNGIGSGGEVECGAIEGAGTEEGEGAKEGVRGMAAATRVTVYDEDVTGVVKWRSEGLGDTRAHPFSKSRSSTSCEMTCHSAKAIED